MTRLLLKLYLWVLNDGSVPFKNLSKILNDSKRYPRFGALNTKHYIYTALEYFRSRRAFSAAQIDIIKRLSDG